MTEASSTCKVEYPKIPDRLDFVPRSARAMDSEDAKFAVAHLSFLLCKAGQGLKALVSGYAERQSERHSFFEKVMP